MAVAVAASWLALLVAGGTVVVLTFVLVPRHLGLLAGAAVAAVASYAVFWLHSIDPLLGRAAALAWWRRPRS